MINVETLYSNFVKYNTATKKDGTVILLKSFRDKYPGMTIDEAFRNVYLPEIEIVEKLYSEIKAIESALMEMVRRGEAKVENSNVSESRYYKYNTYTFRFSDHRYPTGSMSNDFLNIIDFTDFSRESVEKAKSIINI